MTGKKTKTKEPSFVVELREEEPQAVVETKPAPPKKQRDIKSKLGAPSTYCVEIAQEICVRLALGESLKQICKDEYMPAQSTVYLWLLKNPDFSEMYTRAREEQAETHADEIVDIADETPETETIYDKDGNEIGIKLDSAYIQWQRQRIDARKWNAAKQRPRKYGDRVQHEGDDKNPLVIETHVNVFGELLRNLKMERQMAIYGDKDRS